MRLHEFILKNREPILVEWEAFARTCAPASEGMDVDALRDHANGMLSTVASDLQNSQTELERSEKSKGNAPTEPGSDMTSAEIHGSERAGSGFTVEQTLAEFRALRASVLRLWTLKVSQFDAAHVSDMTRFNEAVDQLLAESMSEYFGAVEDSKEMLMGILGHDLRSPLGGIQTAARFIVDAGAVGEPYHGLTARIDGLAAHALQLVGDLLDFTRSRIGGGIPIERTTVDLSRVVHDVVDEILAGHPRRTVQVELGHGPVGQWDKTRIRQALTNLMANAIRHGDQGTAVTVDFGEDEKFVSICIHNHGPPIPADRLGGLFTPWKAVRQGDSHLGPNGNLGLGLYITERIVHAHGGRIDVESSEQHGTTFTVHLPRDP